MTQIHRESVGVKDSHACIAPILFHSPVADKQHQRSHPFTLSAVLVDEATYGCGASRACLGIFLFGKSADKRASPFRKVISPWPERNFVSIAKTPAGPTRTWSMIKPFRRMSWIGL